MGEINNHFINKSDYDATIHKEILDALIREDDAVLDIVEEQTVSEMKSFISGRYDAEAIFAARGSARHPMVLMMARDIAIYHIFSIHNPQKMTQIRKDRYERATKWLEMVASGKVLISGAPTLDVEERSSEYLMKSNSKRINHF